MISALRNRFLLNLLKSQAKQPPEMSGASGPIDQILSAKDRLSLLLDGIKLIGTANGAGALASLAAMYYFFSRPELHVLPVKIAAVIYLVGLLLFAVGLFGYIWGLTAFSDFADKFRAATDPKSVSERFLDRGLDALIVLVTAGLGLAASLVCFLVGTAIGLYVLIRF
jgi:hypothetical protein